MGTPGCRLSSTGCRSTTEHRTIYCPPIPPLPCTWRYQAPCWVATAQCGAGGTPRRGTTRWAATCCVHASRLMCAPSAERRTSSLQVLSACDVPSARHTRLQCCIDCCFTIVMRLAMCGATVFVGQGLKGCYLPAMRGGGGASIWSSCEPRVALHCPTVRYDVRCATQVCSEVAQLVVRLGVQRVVVGHTVQQGGRVTSRWVGREVGQRPGGLAGVGAFPSSSRCWSLPYPSLVWAP